MAAAQVVGNVFGKLGLDEDILEYVASGVEAEEGSILPLDELVDFILPLIDGHCGESEGQDLIGTLHERLCAEHSSDEKVPMEPKKLATAVCMENEMKVASITEMFASSLQGKMAYVEQKQMTWQNTERPGGKANAKAEAREAKQFQKKSERTAALATELNNEVEAARERALEVRATEGLNFNAALKLGPFDLPHPAGGGRPLLENASLTLTTGRRYALVGRNGQGKSTLLRMLAARRVGGLPDAVAVHYVSQDVSFSEGSLNKTPVEVVLEGDAERNMLLKKVEALQEKSGAEDNEELRQCLDQLESIKADTAEFRATKLIMDLGFSEELRERKLKALSGGWRVRVALAAALFAQPDILMLDEPTNHLSMQAVLWLCQELSQGEVWKTRTIIVVSHDRYFIDATCTDTLHICGVARRLTHSRCDYSTWLVDRTNLQRAREKVGKNREKEILKLKDYIHSGQAAAGNTSNTSRKLQLKKLEADIKGEKETLAALDDDEDLPLILHTGGGLNSAAVQLVNVGFSYPGSPKPLFRHAGGQPDEFVVNSESRIVLLGENGNGKTTLVKLLMGELEPTEGEIVRDRGARFALINQHHGDQIDLTMSPLQFMKHKFPGSGSDTHEATLADHLQKCGVKFDQLNVAASALSGGQKSRVAMAAVSFARPHVLIMDEPTNNLDLSSVEILAAAIEKFEGGIVLVSHDQHFVSRLAREAWVVGEGGVRRIESFEAYRAKLLANAVPDTEVAHEAVEAYLMKKLELSAGRVSRVELAKEAQRLLSK